MRKNFYNSNKNSAYVSQRRRNIKNYYNSMSMNSYNNSNNNYSLNKENNIILDETKNIRYNNNSNLNKNIIKSGPINYGINKNKLIQKKNYVTNDKKDEYTYIFYGNNNFIKTRNKNFATYNISAKDKKLKNIYNSDEKNSSQTNINISNNKNNVGVNEHQKYKGTKIHRQLSSDIILNNFNKNNNFSKNTNNNNFIKYTKRDFKLSGKNSKELFPDIYGLNKRKSENELNMNNNYLFNNNDIQIEKLNQLHQNFINSIKNPSGLFFDKEIINDINNDNNDYKKTIGKNKNSINNNFFEKNNNQKWFNNINNEKANEYNTKEEPKMKKRNYMILKKIGKYSCDNISSNKGQKTSDLNKEIKFKKVFDKNLDYNSNYQKIMNNKLFKNNNLNFKEQNNINKKTNYIKLNIKKYLKEKNIIDKKDSKNNSSFSINFSDNDENNNEKNNKQNDIQSNNANKIEKDNNNLNYSNLNNINSKNNSSNLFNFSFKNSNFSYHSLKNMKVEENTNININDDIKEKDKKDNNEENMRNSNVKYNFKTSSYFFSPKFKNKEKFKKEATSNIKEIINNVIENNKKVAQARASTSFYNIGKNYLNNKMRETNKNFYSSSNHKKSYAEAGDTKNTKEKDEIGQNSNKRKFNSIQLTLLSPLEWQKHEELWINISNNNYNEKLEKYFLPPNDTDILISCYLKMYPNKLNINNYSKINFISKNEDFLSFRIDDDIQNPKNEIIKWKNVYKKMIFRWHPDKLFPLLKELKIKNENIKNELQRRCSLIINNINSLYQNISEILRKIVLNKDKNENKSK